MKKQLKAIKEADSLEAKFEAIYTCLEMLASSKPEIKEVKVPDDSLREAVIGILAKGLTKQELIEALEKLVA